METPPVCNYEGSDYQESFWEKGGREYEDAVEDIAIRRLLPDRGKLLLELGAGAGRNTARYGGYEEIVLLDFSHTQLEQARRRLGDSSETGESGSGHRYRYVAADIYRLPFVGGLFDGVTMIRTLHHMADARLALSQVRRVMQTGGIFLLEFANKLNLKAILRYAFGRQPWSPFSPEPIEFAPLNFDFHPGTVRAWLRSSGFVIDRQLTVSHFRMGFLKRLIPLKVLVWLDSICQPTGSLWQFTPSVFLRAHSVGSGTQSGNGQFFCCPSCATALEDTPPLLTCGNCGKEYPVVDGIYDFRVKE